jgi:predicted ATP-grasp superfamily ATP-dependent carboligase
VSPGHDQVRRCPITFLASTAATRVLPVIDRSRHALITDAGRGSAVAFIRSLGRRGWRVTAADSDPFSAGFRSRYTSHRLLHPETTRDPDAVVDAIHGAVIATGIDLVVPVTDEVMLPLAAARTRFDGLTTLAMPDPAALQATQHKPTTLALAERLGIAIPPTRLVRGFDEAFSAAADLGYPLVVKPVASRTMLADGTIGSHAVAYAIDADALPRLLGLTGSDEVLLQRWLPGEGMGVNLLMSEGRPIAAFQHRRLREVPPTGGPSSLRESVEIDPVLYDHAVRLLGELSYSGLAMVEFRRGADGVGYLMEVNGRVWGSLPLAVRAGMDFPSLLVDALFGGTEAAIGPVTTRYRRGVRGRNLRRDVGWIKAVATAQHRGRSQTWPPRRAALGALVSLADPRIADDLLSWSDPGPGLAQLVTIARDGFRRSVGRD